MKERITWRQDLDLYKNSGRKNGGEVWERELETTGDWRKEARIAYE